MQSLKHPKKQIAIIIGAGPAGLTAAFELLTRSDLQPIVLEKSSYMGGISRTVNYKGNRIDIGGHRFFSKSDRVMQWWLELMPPEEGEGTRIHYHGKERVGEIPMGQAEEAPLRGMGPLRKEESDEAEAHVEPVIAYEPACPDRVMLIRPRKS